MIRSVGTSSHDDVPDARIMMKGTQRGPESKGLRKPSFSSSHPLKVILASSILILTLLMPFLNIPLCSGLQYNGAVQDLSNDVGTKYLTTGLYRFNEGSFELINSSAAFTVPIYVDQDGETHERIITGSNKLTPNNVYLIAKMADDSVETVTLGTPVVSMTDGNTDLYQGIRITLAHHDVNDDIDFITTWSYSTGWSVDRDSILTGEAYDLSIYLVMNSEYRTHSTTFNGSIQIPVVYSSGIILNSLYSETHTCSLSIQSIIQNVIDENNTDPENTIFDPDIDIHDLDDSDQYLISGTETTYTDGEEELESVNIAGNSHGGIAKDRAVDVTITIPEGRSFCVGIIAGKGNGDFLITVTYIGKLSGDDHSYTFELEGHHAVKISGHKSMYFGLIESNGDEYVKGYASFDDFLSAGSWFPYNPGIANFVPEKVSIHIMSPDGSKVNENIGMDIIFN